MEKHVRSPDLYQLLGVAVDDNTSRDLNCLTATTVQKAADMGLGPVLFAATKDNPRSTASAAYPVLQGTEITSRILMHGQLDGLQDILTALGNGARHVTLLKGISACLKDFPFPHLRTMGDIDLLVPRDKQAVLEATLLRLGYRQQSAQAQDFYKDHHHSMPFFHKERKIWVDVHTALFSSKSRFSGEPAFSQQQIARNTRPFGFREHQTNIIERELSIIYTACHWADTFPYPRGLMAMLDIIYLFKREGGLIDWRLLNELTSHSLSASSVWLMLSYLRRHSLISLSAGVEKQLRVSQTAINRTSLTILHGLLDRYLAGGKSFGRIATINNVEIVWTALLASRNPIRNFLRVPYYLLFPPESPVRFSPMLAGRRLMSLIKGGG